MHGLANGMLLAIATLENSEYVPLEAPKEWLKDKCAGLQPAESTKGNKMKNYIFHENITADNFILEMLKLGKPIETSLIGVFDSQGRGSRRDIELDFHRDGDYSKDIAAKHSIDYVGLYCIKGGEAKTLLELEEGIVELCLKENQAVIFDNKSIRHARKGTVGDRLLLRVWIEGQNEVSKL
jgi:hypothetical protein